MNGNVIVMMMNFEQLVKDNNKLIWKIAHKYSVKGMTSEDLYQECLMKLWSVYQQYNNSYAITTFIQTILSNHLQNLCRDNNTQERVNKINDNNVEDVRNYDFTRYLPTKPHYTRQQEYVIEVGFNLLEQQHNKEILERIILYGESQISIAKELGVSRQYISKQFNDFISLVNDTL